MSLKSSTDDVLSVLGYGRWQIPFLFLSVLVHMYIPIHVVGSTLLSVPMPFRCFSSLSTPIEAISNASTTSQPPLAIYDSVCEPTNATQFPPPLSAHTTTLASCPVLEYDPSKSPNTVISEFDLVCERSVLRPLFQMLVSLGAPVGSLLGGVISDKYGRKIVIVAGGVLGVVGGVALAACPWYLGVLACRFVLGMTVALTLLPSYSLAQEVTPSGIRSQAGMLVGLGFSVGTAIMAGIGYLVRPWRYLVVIMSSILLVIIPWAWTVGESPRWLAQKGRRKEAADALQRAALRNRVAMTPELSAALHNLRNEKVEKESAEKCGEGSGLLECFGQCHNYLRYAGLRTILLVSPIVWYLQSLLYMGLLLNANNFTSNDPFLYVAMSGVTDGTAIILATPLAMRFGRRLLLIIFYSASGVLLLLDIAIPTETKWLKWILVMTAFLMSSAGYQVQFIYTPELYPTVIRSRGFGLSNSAGNLGIVTAPLLTDLLAQQTWWAVNLVCGTAGIIGAFLVGFLPETRNLPMPETIRDLEKRRRSYNEERSTKVSDKLNRLQFIIIIFILAIIIIVIIVIAVKLNTGEPSKLQYTSKAPGCESPGLGANHCSK